MDDPARPAWAVGQAQPAEPAEPAAPAAPAIGPAEPSVPTAPAMEPAAPAAPAVPAVPAAPAAHVQTDELNILFVCTANQCRSPLAEVIAADQLRRRGVRARVASAGYLNGGAEAAEGSQKAARKRGLDLSKHVSRRIEPDMVNAADVVITMEPGHVLDLSDDVPGAQAWSLTLKELARYAKAQQVPTQQVPTQPTTTQPVETQPVAAQNTPMNTEDIRSWVRAAGSRNLGSLLGDDNIVKDPIGRSNRAFRATAKEIDELLTTVFDAWFGPEPD